MYLRNRGIMGSGHGWTLGWSVLWNDEANFFLVQNPPGAMNWAIGNKGAEGGAQMPGSTDGVHLPRGMIESVNKHDDLTLEVCRESGVNGLNRYVQNPQTGVVTTVYQVRI